MAKPLFKFIDKELENFGSTRIIEFSIPGGVTTPVEFAEAVEEAGKELYPMNRGIVISGRGPIWGYAMILHAAHPTRWIATMDLRLGCVVVQSHTPEISCGDTIPLTLLENIA